MFTKSLFYAYVPRSERALISHTRNIIIAEWNVFSRAIYYIVRIVQNARNFFS